MGGSYIRMSWELHMVGATYVALASYVCGWELHVNFIATCVGGNYVLYICGCELDTYVCYGSYKLLLDIWLSCPM